MNQSFALFLCLFLSASAAIAEDCSHAIIFDHGSTIVQPALEPDHRDFARQFDNSALEFRAKSSEKVCFFRFVDISDSEKASDLVRFLRSMPDSSGSFRINWLKEQAFSPSEKTTWIFLGPSQGANKNLVVITLKKPRPDGSLAQYLLTSTPLTKLEALDWRLYRHLIAERPYALATSATFPTNPAVSCQALPLDSQPGVAFTDCYREGLNLGIRLAKTEIDTIPLILSLPLKELLYYASWLSNLTSEEPEVSATCHPNQHRQSLHDLVRTALSNAIRLDACSIEFYFSLGPTSGQASLQAKFTAGSWGYTVNGSSVSRASHYALLVKPLSLTQTVLVGLSAPQAGRNIWFLPRSANLVTARGRFPQDPPGVTTSFDCNNLGLKDYEECTLLNGIYSIPLSRGVGREGCVCLRGDALDFAAFQYYESDPPRPHWNIVFNIRGVEATPRVRPPGKCTSTGTGLWDCTSKVVEMELALPVCPNECLAPN